MQSVLDELLAQIEAQKALAGPGGLAASLAFEGPAGKGRPFLPRHTMIASDARFTRLIRRLNRGSPRSVARNGSWSCRWA